MIVEREPGLDDRREVRTGDALEVNVRIILRNAELAARIAVAAAGRP